MYKVTGRPRRPVGRAPFLHQPPAAARISLSSDGRTEKVVSMTKKLENMATNLDKQAKKLDVIHSRGKEGQAWGSGVSLAGDLIGLGGVLLVPFSGGSSLLVTAASAGLSIGGGVKGYFSGRGIQMETDQVMTHISKGMEQICAEEKELQIELAKAEKLLEYFKDSGIPQQIIQLAEKIENDDIWNNSWDKACSAVKPVLDCCKSAVVLKGVLMSQRTTKIVRSVLTVRFLIRKSKLLIKYVPEVVLTRSAAFRHCAFPMTGVEAIVRAGPESFRTTVPVMKPTVGQQAGKEFVKRTATRVTKESVKGSVTNGAAVGKEFVTKSASASVKSVAVNAGKEMTTKSSTVAAGKTTSIVGNGFSKEVTTAIVGKELVKETATEVTKESVKGTVTKAVVEKTEVIGKNMVAQTETVQVAGKLQKTTTTVKETAGKVSKLGVGISVLAIALDTYSLIKARNESLRQHPQSEVIREMAGQMRALIRHVEEVYSELTQLHNALLSMYEDTEDGSDGIDYDDAEVGNDAIEDDVDVSSDALLETSRSYLECSQGVLGVKQGKHHVTFM